MPDVNPNAPTRMKLPEKSVNMTVGAPAEGAADGKDKPDGSKPSFCVMKAAKDSYRTTWRSVPFILPPLLTVVSAIAIIGYMLMGAVAAASFWNVLVFSTLVVIASLIAMITQSTAFRIKGTFNPFKVLFSRSYVKHTWTMLLVVSAAYLAGVMAFHVINIGWGSLLGIDAGSGSEAAMKLVGYAVLGGFYTALFVAIRFALVLPEIVKGGKISFRMSWRTTKGNALKIWLAGIISTLPFSVASAVIVFSMAEATPQMQAAAVIAMLLSAILQIMIISALAASAHDQLRSEALT